MGSAVSAVFIDEATKATASLDGADVSTPRNQSAVAEVARLRGLLRSQAFLDPETGHLHTIGGTAPARRTAYITTSRRRRRWRRRSRTASFSSTRGEARFARPYVLDKGVVHVFIHHHDGRLVAATVAVVGRAEHGDALFLVRPLVPLHDELVRAHDEVEAVAFVELL